LNFDLFKNAAVNYDYLEESTSSNQVASPAISPQLETGTSQSTNQSSIAILLDHFKSANGSLLSNVLSCLNLSLTVIITAATVLIKRYLSKTLRTVKQLLDVDAKKNSATNNDLINI
jgi:hypothetical protein